MHTIHDHELSAYLDHELSAERRLAVETALASDPALQQRLQQLRDSNELARRYFNALDQQPLADNLEALIRNARPETATVHSLPLRRRQPWPWATAASLLLAGILWWQHGGSPADGLQPALLQALNEQPSGTVMTVSPDLRLEVVASYRDAQGNVCREVLQHTPQASLTTLACLQHGQWQLETVSDDGHYRTASGPAPHEQAHLSAAEEQQWLNSRR